MGQEEPFKYLDQGQDSITASFIFVTKDAKYTYIHDGSIAVMGRIEAS